MKTQRKKLNPFIVVIMTTVICLTGILSGVSAQNTKKDDTLRILIWEGPDPVWPYNSKAYKDLEIFRIVYEPLASFDADGKLVPILAARIPTRENGGLVADGKSVIWKLKQGVHWADGTSLTVDDVIFTYEHIMSSSSLVQKAFKARYAMVRDVKKIDDHTIKVNFKNPNLAWALPFTGRYGMILPRHILQAYTKADSLQTPGPKHFIGTGPYRMMAHAPQETLIIGSNVLSLNKIVYEANPFFREPGKPAFSRIEILGGGDPGSAAIGVLSTGIADFAWDIQVGADVLDRLEKGGKGRVIPVFGAGVEFIMLNFSDPQWDSEEGEHSNPEIPHPFFRDKRVRQAIAYSIDREAIAGIYGKAGRPAKNMLVSPSIYRSPNSHYEFDLKKAAALLDEAGWKDHDRDGIRDKGGKRLMLRHQTTINPLRQQVQNIVKQSLNSIGVGVDLKKTEAGIFFSRNPEHRPNAVRSFNADLQEYWTGNSNPDPGAYFSRWLSGNIPRKSNNYTGLNFERFASPVYDRLYEQSVLESDPEKRRQLFIRLNDMIVDEVVRIPLVNRASLNAVSNTLKGIDITPWDSAVWKIKDWERK